MSENIPKSVANSLEADPLLLPYMPFLLQDLWELGADVKSIIQEEECRIIEEKIEGALWVLRKGV